MTQLAWIFTYVVPATLGGLTRKYVGSPTCQIIYTHFLLLLSIAMSWAFIENFSWGATLPGLLAFFLASLFSVFCLRSALYVFSAVIQELCILSAFSIAPLYSIPVLIFFFAVLHPTWPVRIFSCLLGLVSIGLFVGTGSVFWSFALHTVAGTLLFHFRGKGMDL